MFYYSISYILTQLKSLAKTTEALDVITKSSKTYKELEAIGKSYTTETLKAAIAQSTLDKEQIKTILSANNLQGELLETTTDELFNAASTNMVAESQEKAAKTTLGLSTAFKGLWVTIKAHPLMTIAMVAPFVISGISKIVDGLITTKKEAEEAQQKIIQAGETARSEIESINSKFHSTKSKIDEIGKRYAELSQGVDQLTGKNVSLNSKDYKEFLDLSNQLAEIFPNLNRNYNDNGDAIVQLSGDVDTIVGSLSNLVEVQRNLTNQQIVEQLPNVFDGISEKSNQYEQQLSDLKKELSDLEEGKEEWKHALSTNSNPEDFSNNFIKGLSDKLINISSDNLEEMYQIREEYIKQLQNLGISFEELSPDHEIKEGIYVPVNFAIKINSSDEDIAKAKNIISSDYEQRINQVNQEISNINEQNKSNWSNLSGSIYSWLSTENDSFKIMDDTTQTTVQNIINNLDWSKLNFSSWEEAKQYIQDNILSLFNTKDGKEILADVQWMFDIQTQFNNGDITVEQYQARLQEFLASIETLPPETKKSILLLFGIETNEDGTTTSDVDTMIANVQKKLKGTQFDDKVNGLKSNDLQIAANLDVPDDSIRSWDELLKRIEEYKKSNIQSFSSFFRSADFSEAKEKLMELARAGELTPETLELEEYNDLLTKTGLEASEAYENIMKLVSANERFSDMAGDLDALASAYKEFQNEDTGYVSAKSIEALREKFGGLGLFDNFTDIAGSSRTSKTQKQEAFNTLVSEYMSREQALRKLTDATKDYYITQLKGIGITNAETLVTEKLEAETKAAAIQEKILHETGKSLFDTANRDKKVLVDQAKATSKVRWELFKLNVEEENFNNRKMDVSSKVEALHDLASAYRITLKSIDTKEDDKWRDPLAHYTERDYENITKELNEKFMTGAEYTPEDSGSDEAYNSGQTDASVEVYDWIERKLQKLSEVFDKFKTKGENVWISFASRVKAYGAALNTVNKQITANESAYRKYMQKADSVGLSAEWAAKVQNGDDSIDEVKDEELKKKIEDYRNWYEKAKACKNAIDELKKSQTELNQSKLELLISKYDKYIEKVSNASDRIQNKIDLKESWGSSASVSNYTSMNKNNQKQISYIINQNAELKKLQKTVTKGSEAWYEYNERIDSNNASLQDLKKTMAENAKAAAELAKAKADRKVEKYDSKDELYDAQIDNAVSASSKDSLVNKKISNIFKRQKAYNEAYSTSRKQLKSSSSSISKMKNKSTKTKNSATRKSNKTYNSVLKQVKSAVKSGKRISSSILNKAYALNDNGNLYRVCVQYNAYYDENSSNKEIADLYAATSKQDKADLAMEKFNHIAEDYDNSISANEQKKTSIHSRISLAEERGEKISTAYYKGLISAEQGEQSKLIKKREELQKSLNNAVANGYISKNSDEWFEAVEEINSVTNAIDESTLSIVEYQNAIRQLKWDAFDDALETVKRINSESDYYINLMGEEKLVDDDTGDFTDYGNAALSLHNINIESYLSQAKAYQDEYNSIMEQIRKGELSAGDENVIARLRELQDAHRDATLSAEEEKNAIMDLVRDAYDVQLNSLSKLIEKYKDLKNSEKESYEYQKSIAEKTRNIAALQKQLSVYGGNDSEEARAQIQKLKVELQDAREDLKETEYDKFISDTESMLDDMYSGFEEWIDKKLDNTNAILDEVRNRLGDEGSIVSTLKSLDTNLTKELSRLITGTKTAGDYTHDTVAKESDNVRKPADTKNYDAEQKAETAIKKAELKKRQSKIASTLIKQWGSKPKKKTYETDVNEILKTNQSYGLVLSVPEMKTLAEALGVSYDNGKKTGGLYKKLKELGIKGFAGGSKRIPYDQMALTQEKGEEIIYRAIDGSMLTPLGKGDMVFTNEMTKRLWEMSQMNPVQFTNGTNLIPALSTFERNINGGDVNITFGDITLPNVTNSIEFANNVEEIIREAVCKNGKTMQCLTEGVTSKMMGKGVGSARLFK